jgi:hypothetical protein
MQARRELMLAEAAWELARRELDEAIGIELEDGPHAAALQAVNLPRFRRAVVEERAARLRYARALEGVGRDVPLELLWDVAPD